MPSVRKLPSGSFQALAQYRDADGKRHFKSFTGQTRRDALQKAADFEQLGHFETVGWCLDTFLSAKKAVLSPSTVRAYSSLTRVIKTHYTAFCALSRPSQADAQRLIAQMLADGSSPKSVKNRIGLISAAVKFCGGTFPRVTLPKVSLRTDFIPSEDDIKRITAEVAGTEMEIPVALGIMGLRRSEICGLVPDDLNESVLHVHAALVYGPGAQHYRKGTKTDKSDRFIMLPDALAEKMTGWSCPLSPMAITHAFRKMAARLGIAIRFHDLRHFFVSYCHNILHLADAQIMKLGGWSSDSIMKRHYLQSMHDEETARLVALSLGNFVQQNVQHFPKK